MTSNGRESALQRSAHVLEVRLGATLVGTITALGHESSVFTFDRTYLEDSARPTLSLGFKGADGQLVGDLRPTRVKLHPFFSNLLPEGHLRDYLAARGSVHPEREFFLLWLLGADLPGGVEVRGVDGSAPPPAEDLQDAPTNRGDLPLRFSLAGVQLKFSAVMETHRGLTLPVGGVGGDWIVKLPSPRFDAVPETEYALMTLAAAVGIDVPETQLVPTAKIGGLPQDLPEAFGQALAVRRFDRPAIGRRIHMEDFAQVFNLYPDEKYKKASYGNIARVLWLETGEPGVTEFVKRLAFHALVGNADAHLKNWSLLYPDGRTPKLAPAYDLVGTVAYLSDDKLALSLAGTKLFSDLDENRFRRFAEKAGLPVKLAVKTAKDTAQRIRDTWPTHEPVQLLPPKIRAAIEGHMSRVPL